MKVIKYVQLYKYLMKEEGLNPLSAYRSIQRVRSLPMELKKTVLQVLDGRVPAIEYHGVTLSELIEKEDMKPVRAILMLDWIRREPVTAMRYMETERLRAPMQIGEKDKEVIRKAMARLGSTKRESAPKDDQDIIVED